MAFVVAKDPLTPTRYLQAKLAPGVRRLRASDISAWADAQSLVEAAKQQAAAIETQAQVAYQQECERGYAEGVADAQMEQAEKMIDTVSRTVDYFAQIEGDMVQLVVQAMRKIVDGYDDTEQVLIVVKNALAVVRNQKQMTLRLHPAQVEPVRARINDILSAYPGVGYLDIVGDARLTAHACILESEIGVVEASIEGQLQAIENAFQKVLGSRV